jgi:hypothetical protein
VPGQLKGIQISGTPLIERQLAKRWRFSLMERSVPEPVTCTSLPVSELGRLLQGVKPGAWLDRTPQSCPLRRGAPQASYQSRNDDSVFKQQNCVNQLKRQNEQPLRAMNRHTRWGHVRATRQHGFGTGEPLRDVTRPASCILPSSLA